METGFGEIDATLETKRDKIYKALDAIFVKALAGKSSQGADSARSFEQEQRPQPPPSSQGPAAVGPTDAVETATEASAAVTEPDSASTSGKAGIAEAEAFQEEEPEEAE